MHLQLIRNSGIGRRRFLRLVTLSLSVIVALTAVVSVSSIDDGRAYAAPPPPPDSFYTLPSGWQEAKPGEILKSRPVSVKQFQVLPLNVRAWQLLYRTTGEKGQPYAAVTTVLIPRGPAKPRPLLSFQAATDSVLRICNPSYGLTRGFPVEANAAGPLTFPTPAAEIALAATGLEQGWAVALPDHGGIDDRFLTPRQPGYAVLDGIRAVERFRPLNLAGSSTPVGLWGYSGGAIASSWAIEEQREYAPELNIQGAAFGAPERDLEASLRDVSGTLIGGLIPLAFGAVLKDQPELAPVLKKYLTREGFARIQETQNHCVGQNLVSNLWFDYKQYLTKPLSVMLADPQLRAAFDSRGVTKRVPMVPSYVYNGVSDEVAPIRGTDRLVRGYCEGGASVTYRREVLPPRPIPQVMSSHGAVLMTGAPGALAWLKTRLSPQQPKKLSGCDIQTPASSALDPEALAMLPPIARSQVQSILGLPIGS